MKRIDALLVAALFAICWSVSGCVIIESSSISDRAGAGASISSSASDIGILRLSAPSNLTETALKNLLGQCATGRVTGVTTELSMREFIVVQAYSVAVTGTCQ